MPAPQGKDNRNISSDGSTNLGKENYNGEDGDDDEGRNERGGGKER